MSARRPRPVLPRRRFTSGFTLVELLVVIGIIVILIGILLPVVNHARKAAWKVDSASAISNLVMAIEKYRQDFGAIPGPIRLSAFDTADGTATTFGIDQLGGLTTSENLVLGLLGGWEPNWAPPDPPASGVFNALKVGSGPATHTPVVSARKRYPAYTDGTPGRSIQQLSPKPASPYWNYPAISLDAQGAYDSKDRIDIPEFMDRFPDQMPILFIPAHPGAKDASAIVKYGVSPVASQYNAAHLKPYQKDSTKDEWADATEFPASSGVDPASTPTERYFRDPSIGKDSKKNDPAQPWQPRQKDGYWLIGAGPDRKFGTKDDQTNVGSL